MVAVIKIALILFTSEFEERGNHHWGSTAFSRIEYLDGKLTERKGGSVRLTSTLR
jgi:hypothetical protein